jgi:hypothetical protein
VSLFRIMLAGPLQHLPMTHWLFLLSPLQRVKTRLSIHLAHLPHQQVSLTCIMVNALLCRSIFSPQHHVPVINTAFQPLPSLHLSQQQSFNLCFLHQPSNVMLKYAMMWVGDGTNVTIHVVLRKAAGMKKDGKTAPSVNTSSL